MALKAGFKLISLPMEKNMAECCTYGGHVSIAHPPYVEHTVDKRIGQNNHPYITYCSNCRDIFTKAGKQTWHVLDIMFGNENKKQGQPFTITERRNNRLKLKLEVLKEFWNETGSMDKPEKELIISQELREKLNKELILESDIYTVIEKCEQDGNKLIDPEKGTFTGYRQIENTTYWVEYKVSEENRFELINAYCHRMKIETD
ncbi:MAG: hypothetical protein HC831_00560 [Chloroflexia bacterium]|nr:hypothetical protein [Chloroflexia bacterium]